MFIRIRGKLHYLWRAVDQIGHVLDVLVQSRRSATAAKRFFRKLLKGLQYVPRVIVTDKLRSYAAAKREIRRKRQMQQFKSPRHAQRFLSTHCRIHNHFQLRRHRLTADQHRDVRNAAFSAWRDVTGTAPTV